MPTYIRLTDYKSSDEKERGFFNPENRYEAKQEDFEKIPGSPIAYWVSDKIIKIFKNNKISKFAIGRAGIITGNSKKFIKKWYELNDSDIGYSYKDFSEIISFNKKWFPLNNGGDSIRWYGNLVDVVYLYNGAEEIQNQQGGSLRNYNYYFKESLNWNNASYGFFAARYTPNGFVFSGSSSSLFPLKVEYNKILLSFLNTKVALFFKKIISDSHRAETGHIERLPFVFPKSESVKLRIDQLTQQNINISKEEWDSRETSWDFQVNELIRVKNEELRVKSCKVEDAYNAYCDYWREKFFQLHANEEELNRLFIDIYELQDELTPDVPLEDITILKNEAKTVEGELVFQADKVMKQLISYGVGVMFGRYAHDHDGLHIADAGVTPDEANETFEITNPTFEADDDNVIPILDGDWFTDDITERFLQFVKVTFGEEHYEENIKFIEDAIGKSIRKYFVKDFYADHVKRYKKRPIYWLFSSPKGSFQALIYMHRYKSDTVSIILNDYLRNFITKLEATKENLEAVGISTSATKSEKTKALKEIEKIKKMLIELEEYEKDIIYPLATQKIEIDLDDGVKHNYPLFGKALKKVVGLS